MSPNSENQVQGIYTGSLNIQEISSVRFANDKNYANRLMDVHNGTDWQPLQVSPSTVSESLVDLGTSSNGMQFVPSFNETMDELQVYTNRYATVFKYE